MSDNQKSFWTTMPGIATGIVSLLTAVVGLITVLNKSTPAQPPGLAITNNVSLAQPVKPKGCEKAVGSWDWFIGGVVTFEKSGQLVWRKNAGDPFPSATGVWSCIDPEAQEMTLFWHPTNMTDTVTLSKDGRSIDGTNYTGTRVTGKKR